MQEKFFIRSEALHIFCALVSLGTSRAVALSGSVELAQSFEEQMQNSGQSDYVAMPRAFADVAYGEFLPYDDLLYFQSNDGTRLLVGKYASMQIATAMAIAFNSFLEVSEPGYRRPNWGKDNNSGIEL